MKEILRIFLAASLFHGQTAFAAYVPGQKQILVQSRTFDATEISSIIILQASMSTAGRWGTFRKTTGTSSGYPVTAGKTLKCWDYMTIATAGAGQAKITLAYGDNDVGYDSVSAPTNVVYQGGAVNFETLTIDNGKGAFQTIPNYFEVPAAKYMAIKSGAADARVMAWCKEE